MQEIVTLLMVKEKSFQIGGTTLLMLEISVNSNICCKKMEKLGKIISLVVSIICILYIAKLMEEQLGKELFYLCTIPEFITYLPLPYEYIKSLITKKPRVLTVDTLHTGKTGNKIVPSTSCSSELGSQPEAS